MPDQYRAVVCRGFGAGDTRVEAVRRVPLQPHQVRVRLQASGVNFPDVLIVQGKYQLKPEFPFVPGTEGAGVIVEVGADGDANRVGSAVMVSMRTGAYAEEAVVADAKALPLPAGFSFAQGATFMVAHTTAYHAIATCGQVQVGQSVLVFGAGGGVGRAAVQIAKHLGAFVIGVASSAEKATLARDAGADVVLGPEPAELASGVLAQTRARGATEGVDVIYDPVGIAPEIALRCVAWGGRVLIVGFAGGTIPQYTANRVLLKGAAIVGVRAGEFGRRFPARRTVEIGEIVRLATIHRPVVTASYPLDHFADALAALEQRRACGRVALVAQDLKC